MKKTTKIILGSVMVVFAIALFDILTAKSGIFGSYQQYTNGCYPAEWWPIYSMLFIIIASIVSVSYWLFAGRDLSETASLFIGSIILFMTGLSDLFYFILQFKPVPGALPWLGGNLIIGNITQMLGFQQVTSISLLISIAIGILVTYIITRELEKI